MPWYPLSMGRQRIHTRRERTRRPGTPSAPLLALFVLLVALSAASPLGVGRALAYRVVDAPGIEIISPSEVLAEHTRAASDGNQLFEYPNGSLTRFVTSVDDPEIRNPGDGTFFPAAVSVVEAAVRSIPAEMLKGLEVQIFILPYPRSGMIGSSADASAIYLTPGVREYSDAEVHFLIAHELGHSFHRKHVPYGDERWDEYRRIRGLEDEDRFRFDGAHADRPQEIFAEDFRVLFGGSLAAGSGSVENDEVLRPDEVPGLGAFFLGLAADGRELADEVSPGGRIEAYPNPVPRGAQLTLRLPSEEALESAAIYGVNGRLVARPTAQASGAELTVDVPSSLSPGAYWLRLRTRSGEHTVPLRIAL
ncbi:MAG: T9SS type A sorting domain-containing protein [Candidatus Eisenbacteria bacterium]|nr:T9SS type A sorting domain-containing protein [Candidatus Eisenbacteria bacterium]